jgi:hypothetical protein
MRAIAAFGVTAFTTIGAYAQPTPARDRPQPPPTGTAIIKGRVVDGLTGIAVARARVRLQGAGNPPPVLTDASGAFQLKELPAGSVFFTVERSGYLFTRYPEPGRTLRSVMKSLTVSAGQVLDGVTVPLYRGGVITGRVVDAYGEPAEHVQLQVWRLPASGHGKPQFRGGGSSTNDLGEFRIARLEPGKYVVRALSRGTSPDDPSDTQPVPTYYPGVLTIDQAQPISIERGQTAAGVEIMLLDGVSSVITGSVVDAKGQPAPTGTYVNAQLVTDPPFFGSGAGGTIVRPDGTFRMKLPPGEYQLDVRATRPGVSGSWGPDDMHVGRLHISVNGEPLSGLTIVVGPGAMMSGTLVFDGDGPPPPNLDQIMIALGSLPSGSYCQSGRATSGPDSTFRVQGIVGTCVARLQGNTGRWTLKSLEQGDVDLMDRPITFEPGQRLRDVQAVLTDRRTELTLHVVDDRGLATRDYVAIIFSTDQTKWTEGSRYIRTYAPPSLPPVVSPARMAPRATAAGRRNGSATVTLPPPDGREFVTGLPPGDYYIVALVDVAAEDSRDPKFIERLAAGARRVSLTDRSPLDVTLTRVEPRDPEP